MVYCGYENKNSVNINSNNAKGIKTAKKSYQKLIKSLFFCSFNTFCIVAIYVYTILIRLLIFAITSDYVPSLQTHKFNLYLAARHICVP